MGSSHAYVPNISITRFYVFFKMNMYRAVEQRLGAVFVGRKVYTFFLIPKFSLRAPDDKKSVR
jgi:hypothetical protein